ncbi:hypothetical protein, partial [Arthrobacter sp.]|uniref:hypothetical protein n=1 Tax=Arthrobacter sp. TaxID=1667 RepID=UPI00258EB18F
WNDSTFWMNFSIGVASVAIDIGTAGMATPELAIIDEAIFAGESISARSAVAGEEAAAAAGSIDSQVANLSRGLSEKPNFRQVDSEEEMNQLYENLTQGAKPTDRYSNYGVKGDGKVVERPDGTCIGRRKSEGWGDTIDVFKNGDQQSWKIHLKPR